MKIKLAAAAAVFMICGALILSTSFAWQTSDDYKLNEFYIAGVRGKLVEVFETPGGGISPADTITKKVDVLNDSGTSVFVRVMAMPVITKGPESPELTLSTDALEFDINTAAWMDGGDGYYYYRELLPPGKITNEPLFTGVKLSANLPAEYKNAELVIYIVSEVCGVNLNHGYRVSFWGGAAEGAQQAVDAIFEQLTDNYFE